MAYLEPTVELDSLLIKHCSASLPFFCFHVSHAKELFIAGEPRRKAELDAYSRSTVTVQKQLQLLPHVHSVARPLAITNSFKTVVLTHVTRVNLSQQTCYMSFLLS